MHDNVVQVTLITIHNYVSHSVIILFAQQLKESIFDCGADRNVDFTYVRDFKFRSRKKIK